MARQSYIVVPNALIMAEGCSAAKRLIVAMLGHSMPRRKLGRPMHFVRKSYAQLKAISGIRSDTTLSRAITQLVKAGLLRKVNHYSFTHVYGRMERTQNTYELDAAQLRQMADNGGYTLIPRELLQHRLTNAQFAVALLLYKLAGSCGVARPSLRQMAKMLRLSKSTVCLALRVLRKQLLFIRILRRIGRGYRKNRYCATNSPFAVKRKKPILCRNYIAKDGQVFFSVRGGPKIGEYELLTS